MSTKNSNFFSRDCMVQALIQLLKTKSLSNITITELTERAGVSRMTYYRNYHSLDEIFSSYLKDLVESYRQDVATWPDKGNYNDSRNMLHCYEYFNHYKEFIACLVQTAPAVTGTGQLHSGYLLYRRQGAGFLLHAPSLLRFPLQYLCHLDSGRFQRIR